MDITPKVISDLFREKIVELQVEPDFQWSKDRIKYAVDEEGSPEVKTAIGNVPLDYDLWKGLRNPALIGKYPINLKDIWEFYAHRRRKSTDESGRQTIFKIPRDYDYAKDNYNRAVIISVMLPFSPEVIKDYCEQIVEEGRESSHLFSRMYEDVNLMIDKAVPRVAIDLVADDKVVVAMDKTTVSDISKEALPYTHQGESHGPCKGGNYPQKSIAVLTGLGQFGVSRIVFRDEPSNGGVRRFAGPIRSIIVFDKEQLVSDQGEGIIYPTSEWRAFLSNLYDFTQTEEDVNKYRFCTYIPADDKGCRKCISYCVSQAQLNSVPTSSGRYADRILDQPHRFWDDKLQFDFASCCEERGQMATLYPEWSCARCVSVCAIDGKRREYAVENFRRKKQELTNVRARAA